MGALSVRWPSLIALLAGLAAASACEEDRSYVLVSASTTSGRIEGYAELEVALVRKSDGKSATLSYLRTPAAPASLDATTPVTFSAGFDGDVKGEVELGVIPLDAAGNPLGFGSTLVALRPEKTATAEVRLTPGGTIPPGWPRRARTPVAQGADAGRPVGPSPSGMDPSSANRCELGAANGCPAGGRCVLACMGSAPAGSCAGIGSKQPGEACQSDDECTAGTQCFAYGCAGGVAKICGRPCTTDGDCGGTTCFTPLPCGGRATGYKVCSNNCDPTGEAATGCGAGLRCILDELGFTECRCVAPTRTRRDGERCTVGADCAIGFTCVSDSELKVNVCRQICRIGAAGVCPDTRVCKALQEPNSKTFGVCEPPG